MEIGEPFAWTEPRALQMCRASSGVLLALVPRRRDRVFTGPAFADPTAEAGIPPDLVRDRLPRWRRSQAGGFPPDRSQRIKGIEHRFQLDAAAKVGTEWLAQRRLSVVCLHRRPGGKYLPAANVDVTVTREPAASGLQFWRADGSRVALLAGTDRPRTDAQGMAEFSIVHPTAAVAPELRGVRILARAKVALLGLDGRSTSSQTEDVEAELDLDLVRNEIAARLEEVFDRPADEKSADRIWLFQPANPDPHSEGIGELQEMLNEVVPRHRAVPLTADGLLTRTGLFDDPTRKMLLQYLEHFPSVHAGSEYPYELKDIGPDPDLLTYLKEEYAPFDPTTKEERGKVVDRRLLVGKVKDAAPDKIDGLWELHAGVVKVLRDQVRTYAQSYLDCDVVWLHRPIHQVHTAANDSAFAFWQDGVILRSAPAENTPPLQGPAGVALCNDGDHLIVVATQGDWFRVRHAAGLGWVRQGAAGRAFTNDAGRCRTPDNVAQQDVNYGTHGVAGIGLSQTHTLNGVGYTYGGKQTPDQWRQSLQSNPHAPPERIVHYDEYQPGHRFGETAAELGAGDYSHMQAGCDCSGFVQNCASHALFPKTDRRIVPASLCAAVPTAQIGAAAWVQNSPASAPTRRFTIFASPLDRRWLRGADVLCTDGHVVLAAEDAPDPSSLDFKILHEWGGTGNAGNAFTRKSVRSPFSWWGVQLGTVRAGKLLIWR